MTDDQYQEMFDNFWDEICEFAESINVPVEYVEDEFLIDGELIRPKPVPIPPRRPQTEHTPYDYVNLEKNIDLWFGSSYEGDIDDLTT